jgi:hypothetical protein
MSLLNIIVDYSTIGEAFALIITLGVLVYQVRLERKDLKNSIDQTKYNTAEKLLSDFSSATLKLVEDSGLREEYVSGNKPTNWDKYNDNQKALYFYFDSLLGLFERVWVSYREMGWIKKADWEQWENWIKDLATNKIFLRVVHDNEKMYDSSFIDRVHQAIKSIPSSSDKNHV